MGQKSLVLADMLNCDVATICKLGYDIISCSSDISCSDDVIGCYGDLTLLQLKIMENSYSNFSFDFYEKASLSCKM